MTKARSPRRTTRLSSSAPSRARQRMQPSCSSAPWMYSIRQGAQRRSTGLEPALPAEEGEHSHQRRDENPEDDPERLARPLAGKEDVHPEDAGDERQRSTATLMIVS